MKNLLQIQFLTVLMLITSLFILSSQNLNAQNRHFPNPKRDSIIVRIDSIRNADIRRIDSIRNEERRKIDSIRRAALDSFTAHHPRLDSLNAKHLIKDSIRVLVIQRLDSIRKAEVHKLDSIRNARIHKLDSIRFAEIKKLDSIRIAELDSIRKHHGGRIDETADAEMDNNNVSITVFPNPVVSSTVLHIENASSSNLIFRMYEVSGRLIITKENLGNGDYSLGGNNLASGLYLYVIYDGNTWISTGKLLVQ